MRQFSQLTFILFPIIAFSQPTLQLSWAPQPGDTWKQSLANEIFEPGPAGANQIWDFSSATLMSGGGLEFHFKEKSEGIQSDCFPDATLAADLVLDGFGSGFAFGYYGLDIEGFKSWGDANDFGGKTIYTDPQEFKFIGLQFGASTTDNYEGQFMSDFSTANIYGNTTYEYDAYGTVILPNGTFDNVVRLHQIDITIDTSTIGGLLLIQKDTLESYGFMPQGSIFPVAIWQKNTVYTETVIGGVSMGSELDDESLTFSFHPDFGIVSSISDSKFQDSYQISPTLADRKITINGLNTIDQSSITIINLQGNIIRPENLGISEHKNGVVMDISSLQTGHYFIYHKKQSYLGRFIKY